jgi:GT2 family glycosyltransferase
MAAHWLVPTRVIRKVGLFNEELFPHWGQDDDWCQRLDFYGLKIGVVEEARGVHDRATRQESVEKLVKRNFYTGSLIRLCDVRRPLWERFFYVLLFTAVKSIKYRSLLPFKYLRTIVRQLPQVRNHRTVVRARA